MIKASLVFVLAFLFAAPLFAQQVDTAWVRRYNGPGNGNDVACAIAVDSSGNVYVAGTSYDSVTSNDYAIIKYYPNGDTAWIKRYNSSGNSNDGASAMVFDPSGYIYVTGTGGTVKYDILGNFLWSDSLAGVDLALDGQRNVLVTGPHLSDTAWYTITAKYYPDGNVEWSDTLVRFYARALTADYFGNVYVAGLQDGYSTIKYYPHGDTAWVRGYRGPAHGIDVPVDIGVDGLGNVYVSGTSADTTVSGSSTQFDIVTVKYDINGHEEWVRTHDASGRDDHGRAQAVDYSGNVWVAGDIFFKVWADGVTLWYGQKYDYEGNPIGGFWLGGARPISYSAPNAICIDQLNNAYVTGWIDTTGRSWDYATLKLNAGGGKDWVSIFRDVNNRCDEARAIAVDRVGNIYVTGRMGGSSSSAADFDYGTIKYWQNYSPILAVPDSSKTICSADTLRFRVTATDQDFGDTLTLSGPGIPTPTIGISPLTVDVKNYISSPGIYNYVYSVTDKHGASATDTADWEIRIDSPPQVVAPDSSKGLCVPDTVRFTVTATDIDVVDTLTLSGPGITTPFKGVSPLNGDVKLYINSSGTYNYVYEVTDECGFTDYDTATLIVTVNSSPAVTAPDSSKFYCVPDTIRLRVTATDPDGADTLTLSGPGIPAPVKGLSPLNADVKFYIDTSGTFRYVYDVTDQCGFTDSDTAAWVVTVNRPPNPFSNLAPSQDSIIIYPSGLEHIVNFRWETSTDPNPGDQVKYDLLVSTSSTFHPDSTVVHHGLSTNEYTDTLAIGRYYWKVRAYDNCTGTWSAQIWTFLSAMRGDANADKKVTVADVVYLVNFLFKSGPAPNPFQVGDVNCNGYVTVSDVVYLINYLFKGGPLPCEPQ